MNDPGKRRSYPMIATTMIRAAAALTTVLLLAVACGSGSDPTASDATATSLPTTDVMVATPTAAVETPPTAPGTDATPTVVAPPPAAASPTASSTDPDDEAEPEPSDNPGLSLSDQPLALRGIGRLEAGMTIDEAAEATGLTIAVRDDASGNEACRYAQVVGDPESPWLMVLGSADGFDAETIVRIEVAGATETLSGIHIGSTKAEVLAAYGDRIEVTPHKYTSDEGGEYLTYVPADAVDADYRLIFETLDDKVTEIRSGLLPAVEWVEGCL